MVFNNKPEMQLERCDFKLNFNFFSVKQQENVIGSPKR